MRIGQLVLATAALYASRLFCVHAATSHRAKCGVDCYTKCVSSGTPKAVYCDCTLRIEQQPCTSINEELIKKSLMKEAKFVADTHYKDVRTISIRIQPYTGAFIYVFEYSTVSVDNDNWIFAGASSSPQITFTVSDACRDYQFRVLVVIRSTDPFRQLVVFPPTSIPVTVPNFAVPPESIRLDEPRQSSDNQSLHVFVSWHHPKGYDDADIYGYESPVAYPELVEGGARMHLSLPIEVLRERCRIYVEVRMIPRCVRIDSFDVQASVELDCDKFAALDYCRKDMSPQCADIVDVWGKDGKAMIVWQQPHRDKPQYYVVNFGVAEITGTLPIVTRKLSNSEEIEVPGNVTHVELDAEAGVHYGVQICGIYSDARAKSPFSIVPVIPFMCHECQENGSIECSKEEDADAAAPLECNGRSCEYNNLTNRFVPLDSPPTRTLGLVNGTLEAVAPLTTVEGNVINPQQRHSKTVTTDLAIPLNVSQLTFTHPQHLAPTDRHERRPPVTRPQPSRAETTTRSSLHLELPEFESVNAFGLLHRDLQFEELSTTHAVRGTNASTGRPSLAMRPHFNGSAQQIDIETTTTSPQSTAVPFVDLATTVQTRAGFGSRGDDAEESQSAEPADGVLNSMPTRLGPQDPTSSLEGRVDVVSVSAPEGTTVPLVPPTEPAHPAQDKETRQSFVERHEEGTPGAAAYRGFLIFIGPAFLVVGVIVFGLVVACVTFMRRRRRTPVRHLGLLGDQTRHRFTTYRPGSLRGSTTVTPANLYNDPAARYYMARNVHF